MTVPKMPNDCPQNAKGRPPPGKRPLAIFVEWSLLVLPDVLRLEPLRALHDVELHAVAFGERPETVHLDGGVMDEDVLPTLLRDEAETLAVVEPLHSALRHETLPSFRYGRIHPPSFRAEIGSRTSFSD